MNDFADLKILLVDSVGHTSLLLRDILRGLGVKYLVATRDTDDACRSLRSGFFDIAFCDEQVGPLKPFDFVQAVRSQPMERNANTHVVVWIVVSTADTATIAAAREARIDGVIIKPVSPATIVRKLRSFQARTPFAAE